MQIEAVGGPLFSQMQSSTGQRDLDAAPGQAQGLRGLGRSRCRWFMEMCQESRYIPLSVVATPQVDAEIFHTQHNRVRGNEEPKRREVERKTFHVYQRQRLWFWALGYRKTTQLQAAQPPSGDMLNGDRGVQLRTEHSPQKRRSPLSQGKLGKKDEKQRQYHDGQEPAPAALAQDWGRRRRHREVRLLGHRVLMLIRLMRYVQHPTS